MILLNILWLYCREETDGREESCSCCCVVHARHAVRVRPAAGGRIHRGFCWCFGSCYPGCREGNPAWLCTIKCVESCTVPIAAFGAGDCSKICLASICGAAETGDGKRRLLYYTAILL
jgi:hypothetical protein